MAEACINYAAHRTNRWTDMRTGNKSEQFQCGWGRGLSKPRPGSASSSTDVWIWAPFK